MDWLRTLGDLSPVALVVVALWIMSTKVVMPMLRNHKEVTATMAETFEKHTESLTNSLDENTKAVRQATKHNEEIVSNHLSKQSKRDVALILEMRAVATAVQDMNSRRRETDVHS